MVPKTTNIQWTPVGLITCTASFKAHTHLKVVSYSFFLWNVHFSGIVSIVNSGIETPG